MTRALHRTISFILCHHPSPHIAFNITMSENTSQSGKSTFSISYPHHLLTTTVGKWGYVGKAPPHSSTSSTVSSTGSQASVTASRVSATSRNILSPIMPPHARPTSCPKPVPKSLEASSQPVSGTALPTSFRFLRQDMVTLAPAPNIPAVAKPPESAPLGSTSIPVRAQTPANIPALTKYPVTTE